MGFFFRVNFTPTMPGFSPKPVGFDGPAGLHRGQEHSQRQQGRHCEVRGHQPFWQLLQEQVESAEVLETEVQCQARTWPLPLPCPIYDVLADSPRNGSPQNRERKGSHEKAPDFRGCPSSLKVLRLKPGRKFCSLGRLSHDVGWKYQDVIETLEAKRKVKAQDYHNRTVAKDKLRADAEKAVEAQTKPITAQIAAFGVVA